MNTPLPPTFAASNTTNIAQPHHRNYVRMFFATLFGMAALNLILASILVVWLNRTLTDTDTYVKTVAPLVQSPEIQQFITLKASEAVTKSAPPADIATALLGADSVQGKTAAQLQNEVTTVVTENVKQIITSKNFQNLWVDTNKSAHTQLVAQLQGGSNELTLDLSPAIAGAIAELRSTKLAPFADKIEVPDGMGKFNLTGGPIEKAHEYYRWFQAASFAIVGAALLSACLSIFISSDHIRTMRRILMGTGILSLLTAVLIQAPTLLHPSGMSPAERDAVIALASALLTNLLIALYVIGGLCIVASIGSKVYSTVRARRGHL